MQQRRRAAVHPEGRQGLTVPDEPLALSAPLARRLAPQLCRKDPATGESCAWYHGFWQYARLFGLGSSPTSHLDFLTQALAALRTHGRTTRILISGTGDYSMLANLLAAPPAHAADITVVDWCETPLALNRWYAERRGRRVTTTCTDILEYSPAEAFDAICTHAFFSYFGPTERPRMLSRWRDLLHPGGMVIAVNRLRPHASDSAISFSEHQVGEYRNLVLAAARSSAGEIAEDAESLARDAETYARRTTSWPLRSRDEAAGLLESAGFSVDRLTTSRIGAGAAPSGPTVPRDAEYAEIIARRA